MGLLRWYNKYQRELISQERAFKHLENQTAQISLQVATLDKRFDEAEEKSEEMTASIVEMRGAVSQLIRQTGSNTTVQLPTFGSFGEPRREGKNA